MHSAISLSVFQIFFDVDSVFDVTFWACGPMVGFSFVIPIISALTTCDFHVVSTTGLLYELYGPSCAVCLVLNLSLNYPQRLGKCYILVTQKEKGLHLSGVNPLISWCRGTESNCRHGDFQSPALPTELPRLFGLCLQMASEFEKTFFIKPLNFCQHIFLAHKQLQIKFET